MVVAVLPPAPAAPLDLPAWVLTDPAVAWLVTVWEPLLECSYSANHLTDLLVGLAFDAAKAEAAGRRRHGPGVADAVRILGDLAEEEFRHTQADLAVAALQKAADALTSARPAVLTARAFILAVAEGRRNRFERTGEFPPRDRS